MSIFSLMEGNKGNLAFAGLFGATLVFLSLVFFANDYSVQTDYLVIQESADKQDFYTLSKSVEYSGNILKEAVASDLFFSEAVKTGYFNAGAFSSNERDRLKEWRKSITVGQRSGAGILEVTVKRSSQVEAVGIARAVSDVLIQKNNMFRSGTPESITIKTISGPIVEQNPTVKNLIAGVVAGMLLGMSALLFWKVSREGRSSEKIEELFFKNEQELELYRRKIAEKENLEKDVPSNLPFSGSVGYTS